jgi:two-component system sensor histidine kinase PilS (NtrC family)
VNSPADPPAARGPRIRRGAVLPPQPATLQASWFGSLSLDQPSELEPPSGSPHPAQPPGDGEPVDGAAGLRTPAVADPGTFARIYRAFASARVGVGLVLLAAQMVPLALGNAVPGWSVGIALAYALQTFAAWWLRTPLREHRGEPRQRLGRRQWAGTIGADLLTLSALHVLAEGSNLNYPAFLVLPALMAGVLTSRRQALAAAAAATLMLLATAVIRGLAGGELTPLVTQAGLLGGGLFLITLLAGEMSARLAREQQTARGSLELARQQAQINRLVIDEMQDGVLVVDRHGRVRSANPAARRLLSAHDMTPPAPFPLRGQPAWQPLEAAVEQAFAEGLAAEGGASVTLDLPAEGGALRRELRLRVRFTRRRDAQAPEDLCVLFLEDMRHLQTRSRQEKLAAMGRMSAGIAHEIRNPLAAIAQANALMGEDAVLPGQAQLSRMIADNVERLKRIVDDILTVAPPGQRPPPPQIDLAATVERFCTEWRQANDQVTGPHADGLRLDIAPGARALGCRFEPDHLQRVLVNLLDNAWRHGSRQAGSVVVQLHEHGPRGIAASGAPAERPVLLRLSVLSDGPPIAADVERSLFEPFFSTRSRGTGLGLYICRELCERYGASIDYRQHPGGGVRHRNEFFLTLRAQPLTPP